MPTRIKVQCGASVLSKATLSAALGAILLESDFHGLSTVTSPITLATMAVILRLACDILHISVALMFAHHLSHIRLSASVTTLAKWGARFAC